MIVATKKIASPWHVLVIIAFGFIVYASSIGGQFVWDDYGLVKENPQIKSLSNIPRILVEPFGSGGTGSSYFYRPLQAFVHMAGYAFWGLSVGGYHLTSIVLHIVVALSIYTLISILFCDRLLAFLASLLFTVHPVHTESVCYISGVSDPLAFFFILVSLIVYITADLRGKQALYGGALSSFVFALLSKETAVMTPAYLLLYHYAFKRRVNIKYFAAFIVVLAGYIVFRTRLSDFCLGNLFTLHDAWQRIPTFFAALNEYFRILIVPLGLHIEYAQKLFPISDVRVIAGCAVSSILICIAFTKRKSNNFFIFCVAWFFIALIPVSNIFPINSTFMMEHWLYVPSLGFFLACAGVATPLLRSKAYRIPAAACFAVIVLACSYLTIKQCAYWKDPVVLYKKSLSYTPGSWRFNNELGIEYANRGRFHEAIDAYKQAVRLNPDLPGVYYNLGQAYAALGNKDESTASYLKGQKITLRLVGEYRKQGSSYIEAGEFREAISAYLKTITLDPGNTAVWAELGGAYVLSGQYKKAIASFEKVLEKSPDSAVVHNNAAVAYYYDKQYGLAIAHCDKAVALGYTVAPQFLELLKYHRK